MIVRFDVIGDPKPQGSKKAFVANGRAIMTEGNTHAAWRNQVADAARQAAIGLLLCEAPLDGPLEARVEFRFAMPKSRPKRVRDQGESPKTTAPDVDKLVRTVFDGLQAGGLIADDSRVWRVVASKVETTGWTGCTITLAATA